MSWQVYVEALTAVRTVRASEQAALERAAQRAGAAAAAARHDRDELRQRETVLRSLLRGVQDELAHAPSEVEVPPEQPPPADREALEQRAELLARRVAETLATRESLQRQLDRLRRRASSGAPSGPVVPTAGSHPADGSHLAGGVHPADGAAGSRRRGRRRDPLLTLGVAVLGILLAGVVAALVVVL